MTVKLIISITDLKENGIDFNFTFEDEDKKTELERNIAEHLAAISLDGLKVLNGGKLNAPKCSTEI